MTLSKKLENVLQNRLSLLKQPLDSSACNALLHYLKLLQKWNAVHNLTGIKDIAAMIPYHILDSLSVVPYVVGPRIIDVGTGAGLPGIPLAIRFPEYEFFLLESQRKKVLFLRHAVSELKLPNVTVVHKRSLEYKPEEKFNTVVSRATMTLSRLLKEAAHLMTTDGILLSLKGKYPQEELLTLPPFVRVQVIPYSIPFLNQTRHVVRIDSLSPTLDPRSKKHFA